MGQTQHTIGNAMVRASCILQKLALGNVGRVGGGANIFAATTTCRARDRWARPRLAARLHGLAEGAWKHFADIWGVDFEWIKKQYASPAMSTKTTSLLSRWIDGMLEKNEKLIDQDSNLRGVVFWGHAPNSQTRGLEMKRADGQARPAGGDRPLPSATAAMAAMPGDAARPQPQPRVYLLPAVHPVRDQRLLPPRPTARCSGARRSSSRCGRAEPTT